MVSTTDLWTIEMKFAILFLVEGDVYRFDFHDVNYKLKMFPAVQMIN